MISDDDYEEYLKLAKEYEEKLGVDYAPGTWGNIEQMKWCIKEGKPLFELMPELRHAVY